MHRIILGPMAAALILGIAPAAAQAETSRPEDEAFQKRLFGRVRDKTSIHACFSRAYDVRHLAGHPAQKVRTMRLLVTASAHGYEWAPTYDLAMGVSFRRSGTKFQASGSCGSIHDQMAPGEGGTVAHCGVDCEGGKIDVTLKDEGSVLVAIPTGASTSSAHGDRDGPRFGADDRLFRLDRTDLADCLNLTDDPDTRKAIRRGE